MKVTGANLLVQLQPHRDPNPGVSKHGCWDPKDGELYLDRVKPEETLVEARSGSDVQIDRRIWV